MPNAEGLLPASFTRPIAWDAFNEIVHANDWRPIVVSREPLTFDVEMDDALTSILNGAPSWRARDQARRWIANRIVQMVRKDFTKTTVRSASLQVRDDGNDDDLLQGVKDRVVRNLRCEIHRYFDDSLQEWVREAFDHWGRMTDYGDQQRFRSYAGLDLMVPHDVTRKAVHYVVHRVPWTFEEEINLALVRDRRRFRLEPPAMDDPRTEELLARQKPRLFVPIV